MNWHDLKGGCEMNWHDLHALSQKLDNLSEKLEEVSAKIEEISAEIERISETIFYRIQESDERVIVLYPRFDKIESQLKNLEKKIDKILEGDL